MKPILSSLMAGKGRSPYLRQCQAHAEPGPKPPCLVNELSVRADEQSSDFQAVRGRWQHPWVRGVPGAAGAGLYPSNPTSLQGNVFSDQNKHFKGPSASTQVNVRVESSGGWGGGGGRNEPAAGSGQAVPGEHQCLKAVVAMWVTSFKARSPSQLLLPAPYPGPFD